MAKLRRNDDLESGSSPFQLNNVAVLNVVYNGFRVFVMHLSMFSPGGGGGGWGVGIPRGAKRCCNRLLFKPDTINTHYQKLI